MSLKLACLILAVVYGIICGGVYTWISPRRRGSWPVMLRSTLLFTLLGLLMAGVIYFVLR